MILFFSQLSQVTQLHLPPPPLLFRVCVVHIQYDTTYRYLMACYMFTYKCCAAHSGQKAAAVAVAAAAAGVLAAAAGHSSYNLGNHLKSCYCKN